MNASAESLEAQQQNPKRGEASEPPAPGMRRAWIGALQASNLPLAFSQADVVELGPARRHVVSSVSFSWPRPDLRRTLIASLPLIFRTRRYEKYEFPKSRSQITNDCPASLGFSWDQFLRAASLAIAFARLALEGWKDTAMNYVIPP